VIGFLIE
jgi:hypothetical protein